MQVRFLPRDLVSKSWRHLADERKSLFGLGALSLVAAQGESAALILIAVMADTLASGESVVELSAGPIGIDLPVLTAGGITLGAIATAALAVYLFGFFSAKTYARLERQTRDAIVAAYGEATWEYQATQKSSRVHGRLMRLMNAHSNTFSGLVGWVRAAATILIFVGAAAFLSPVGALVIVGFGALLSLAVFPIRQRIKRLGGEVVEGEVGVAADFAEAVEQGADVHVFGVWPTFSARFGARSNRLEDLVKRLHTVKKLMPVVYEYGALTLILGVLLVASGVGATGEFGTFAASALLLLRSVQYGQQLQLRLQTLAESVPRIELLDEELDVPPPRIVPGDATMQGVDQIELRHVSYAYPGSDDDAINNVSLILKSGSVVGIAGPSGSGKSTLAQVLLRLRWPISGEYLVNGRSAQEYSESSWNRFVTHVPQHPRLFHGTLYENVSFLDESISRDQAQRALEMTGLGGLVSSLVDGLETEVGPTGRSLSGGQVQRLGIARAIARDPRLIILDEPTSALDVDAERIVGEALDQLRGRSDMMVLVIAHRASTLALCDEMIVLEDGHLSSLGSANQVADESAFFARTRGVGNSTASG